jgi:hypothetical protein
VEARGDPRFLALGDGVRQLLLDAAVGGTPRHSSPNVSLQNPLGRPTDAEIPWPSMGDLMTADGEHQLAFGSTTRANRIRAHDWCHSTRE